MLTCFTTPIIDNAKVWPFLLCYFGWHYVAFFYSAAERLWVSFDDSAVRPIGQAWADVHARHSTARSAAWEARREAPAVRADLAVGIPLSAVGSDACPCGGNWCVPPAERSREAPS